MKFFMCLKVNMRVLLSCLSNYDRAMQKMKQFRRLKLEEVKVLAEEGIELNAVEYQRQVEEREAQRKKEKEARLAREAMITLEALEREEQQAAEAAAKVVETPAAEGEADMKAFLSVLSSAIESSTLKSHYSVHTVVLTSLPHTDIFNEPVALLTLSPHLLFSRTRTRNQTTELDRRH